MEFKAEAYGICIPYGQIIDGPKRQELIETVRDLDNCFLQQKAEGIAATGFHQDTAWDSWDEARSKAQDDSDGELLEALSGEHRIYDELFKAFFGHYDEINACTGFLADNGEHGLMVFIRVDDADFHNSMALTGAAKQELQWVLDDLGVEEEPAWNSYKWSY